MPFEDSFKEMIVGLIVTLIKNAFEFFNVCFAEDSFLNMLDKSPKDVIGAEVVNKVITLSDTAIIPVAAIILTYVVCYDLITTCISGNNFRDFDTSIFFKFVLKGGIATYLLGKSTTIAFAFFDVGTSIAVTAKGELSLDVSSTFDITTLQEEMLKLEMGQLLGITLTSLLLNVVMIAVFVIVIVVILGRAIEAVVYCAFAPIPIATLTNREWGSIGNNYLKALAAISLQIFVIMTILGINSGLMQDVLTNAAENINDLQTYMIKCVAYEVVLCFTLLKSGNVSKSLLQAH